MFKKEQWIVRLILRIKMLGMNSTKARSGNLELQLLPVAFIIQEEVKCPLKIEKLQISTIKLRQPLE